ncbi:hypothetical protein LPJ55_003155 [Coemansia sp. RSA 990]|nr:vitamin B6 photo-protection and homoeostasis-domain-containing protein [Coemansia mojavensis]KAJ1742150.1 hypothetical protein LPJ68_002192 [Coemansia sp. RSA 1086]KAJ1872386.1 hypothetical protein LPJ55_003155 [Coemansia sp. RSA 990]KAJ2671681.1 hypothetical protein IWW42_003292 [Coemansia sp. RSA 1085]
MYSQITAASMCRCSVQKVLQRPQAQHLRFPACIAFYTTQTKLKSDPDTQKLVLRQGRIESTVRSSSQTPQSSTHDLLPTITHNRFHSKADPPAIRQPAQVSSRVRYSLKSVLHAFLPTDYRTSVTPEYLGYTKWQFIHNVFGSASGVLATQAMLYAMGLGAGALPLSAAINWVIKDGFGQLGGVVYATMVGQKFDSDPKHQRFWSSVWLQTATWLEMLTPLFPHMFLAIGSIANIGKNIAWLAMSATKASINKTFCVKENLGDVTAKHGSQATAAGLIGTAVGVLVGAAMDVTVNTLILAFVPISLASLWGNYKSLLYTVTPTLNVERARLLLQEAISVDNGRLVLDPALLRTPREVAISERFMLEIHSIGALNGMPGVTISANISQLERSGVWNKPRAHDSVVTMLNQAFNPCVEWNERYYTGHLPGPSAGTVFLWFDKRAQNLDILLGFYHAMAYRSLVYKGTVSNAHWQSYAFAKQTFADACRHIEACGWDTSIMYFGKKSAFVQVKCDASA